MNDTAVAGTFAQRYEAEFAQATLNSAGIDCALISDDAGGAYVGLRLTGPYRVLVRASDLEEARTLIGEDDQ